MTANAHPHPQTWQCDCCQRLFHASAIDVYHIGQAVFVVCHYCGNKPLAELLRQASQSA